MLENVGKVGFVGNMVLILLRNEGEVVDDEFKFMSLKECFVFF